MNDVLRVLYGTFAESGPKDFSEPIDDDVSGGDYSYYSDSDLEEDEDVANSEERPKETVPLRGHPFDPFCFSTGDDAPTRAYGERKESPEKGKIIKIKDVAFISWVISVK